MVCPPPPAPLALSQDTLLKDAVKRYGRDNWKRVAEALGGDRTDAQCCSRFTKSLNPTCVIKGPWTKEVRLVVERVIVILELDAL